MARNAHGEREFIEILWRCTKSLVCQITDKHVRVLILCTHRKASFMSICRCRMPGLDLRSKDDLYFAIILSALVHERLDDTVNSANHLRTT